MAKHTMKPSRHTDMSIPGSFAGMNMFNGTLAECYTRAGQAFFTNAFKFNQEILRFTTERFQADFKALQALSRCTDWSELAGCQTDFARSAAEAYEAEVSKLAELSNDATNATLAPLRDAAETISEKRAEA